MNKGYFKTSSKLCHALGFMILMSSALVADIEMKLTVDASEISRKLLHARIELPVKPGHLELWYPKWIPGIHAPRGPISNITGLRIKSHKGKVIQWNRDRHERYLFHCDIPDGVKKIVIQLDYICNQPSVNSKGIDSYGNALLGCINWNTCLLYPDGYSNRDIIVDLSLEIPKGWKWGSSLISKRGGKNSIQFESISLHDLIDSPLIMGKYFRKFPLKVSDISPFTLHVVSESEKAIDVSDEVIETYGNIATEFGLMLGKGHFDRYEWLLICSDDLPNLGLEHLKSSLNGIEEKDLIDDDKLLGWAGSLLPHELAHSWCGKFRRPEGMDTFNFHTNKDTHALWVYEGLTTHLGELLPVRGGLWSIDLYKEKLAGKIAYYMKQTGREWRSLEDTAIDSYHLRGGSSSWSKLRRGQDYYSEGLLFWLDVDTILREKSDGKYTLDDFCRKFLGAGYPKQSVLPFGTDDIINLLNEFVEYDWAGMIEERIRLPQKELNVGLVGRLGYKLDYTDERPEALKNRESDREYASASDSIGMDVGDDGKIKSGIIPGMLADSAGLVPGMEIIGVNGRKFSLERFREAIEDTVKKKKIKFLVLAGEEFKKFTIKYSGGAKYMQLVRDESKPDLLTEIYSPRRKIEEKESENSKTKP